MAEEQEINWDSTEYPDCSVCSKLLPILGEDLDKNKVKCDDCHKGDSVMALCITCTERLCEFCNDYHIRKEHKVIAVGPVEKTLFCPLHSSKKLDHYCKTCEDFICYYCVINEHKQHKYNTMEASARDLRSELTEITAPVDEMIISLNKAKRVIGAMKDEIENQVKKIENMIDKCYTEQLAKLNECHKQLKKQLQGELLQKKEKLTTQLEGIKTVQDELANMKKQREGLEKISYRKVLSQKKKDIKKSVQEVSEKYKMLNTLPVETDSIKFVPVNNPNLLLGHLFTSAYPNTSEVVGLPRNIGHNSKVDVAIQTRNCKVEKCTKGGHQVSVELKSATGNVTIGEVKDNNDGSYVASFVAEEVGVAKLSVSIKGQQIRGSPYSIIVGRNYKGINIPDEIVNGNGKMGAPSGTAFNKDGMWAVADSTYHGVHLFSNRDEYVRTVGSHSSNGYSSGNGYFNSPHSIVFNKDDHFYVVESGNNRVQKFSANGNYLLKFGNDAGDGKLSGPQGITIHNNKVYVADYSNGRIAVFQTNGHFCTSFRTEHLKYPTDVAVDTNNQLLVLDRGNHCVVTFTLDGHYVGKFGKKGSGRGELDDPHGLGIDVNGFILIADTNNHRVSIFDKSGKFIDSFGSKGSNAGQFNYPRGIGLSPNGSIYVSDSNNSRVQIFSKF